MNLFAVSIPNEQEPITPLAPEMNNKEGEIHEFETILRIFFVGVLI